MSSGQPPIGGLTEIDDRTHRLPAGPPPVHPPTLTAGRPTTEDWAAVLRPAVFPGELGRLGPYRVLGVLGRGGMGVVFLAEDPGLDRRIALKTLLPGAGRDAAARFLREARAQAAIEHDHVVTVHQVGEDAGVPFLAMPLLQGQTLAAALTSGRLAIREVLRVGAEIADGLAAAHARGLIHRDIKPSNIWLEGDRRRVKLLDFGLARATAASPELPSDHTVRPSKLVNGPELTVFGQTVGTPAYMSPEQSGGQPVDHRTDLFSLGALLYHAATGLMPFTGSDSQAVMKAVRDASPPAPALLNPDLPTELNALIVRLLAKNPADRLASAETVATELRAMASPTPRRRSRRVWLALAALGTVLALAGLFTFPQIDPRHLLGGANGRLTRLVIESGGEVQLSDGTVIRAGERPPPPPHRLSAVNIGWIDPQRWRDLFEALCRADTLNRVEFHDSPLTDANLASLSRSPVADRLETLAVIHCPHVSDRGLSALGSMTRLRQLRLDLFVAPQTVQQLANELPRCRIEWPGGVVEPRAE